MQAAGLLKEKKEHGSTNKKYKAKPHQPMAKPVLVASITQDNSNMATLIHESEDGMNWITEHVKLPNGKSAWGGKNPGEKKSDTHKRWVNANKNKIGDSSAEAQLGKSPDGRYRQTGVVNIVLYVGFGLITLGLIITFVGLGEHGFKSPELKLIGPSLIGCGVLFCLLRLFFCSVPACCNMCRKNKQLDEKALLSPSRETLAEDSTEDQNIPRPLQNHEAKDTTTTTVAPPPPPPPIDSDRASINSKSAHTIRSTIPNYIEDEADDNLGLHVEYIEEGTDRQSSRMSSRPLSSQSHMSATSRSSKLPEIHSNGNRTDSELVLNPATLQGAGD